jgi:hypothetical protein
MQHQCEDRAISQVIANRCEEFFDFFLTNVSGQLVALFDISLDYIWSVYESR